MKIKNQKHLFNFFTKEVRTLYVFAAIIITLGWIIDVSMRYHTFNNNYILLNLFLSIILGTSFVATFFKFINVQFAYIVLISASFTSQIFEHFSTIGNEGYADIIFRDLFTFPLILVGVALINKRIIMILITIIFTSYIIFISYYSGEIMLINNLPYFVLMIVSYSIALMYFLNSIIKAIHKDAEYNKQIEQHKNKLEELNIQNNKLFSIIGHDLRGPILTTNEVLKLVNEESVGERTHNELLKSSEQSMEQVGFLLENLLYWGKQKITKNDIQTEKINIYLEVYKIINMYQLNINSKSIEIIQNIDTDKSIISDLIMFQISLRNIISNAIKFTPKDGEITISTEQHNNENIIIEITNTGQGIEKENLEKLFDKNIFYTTKGTKYESGSGIGLKLSKEFIEQNKGTLQISSVVNDYTKATIILPIV